MEGLSNAMRREAERAMQGRSMTRIGIVTNYDPSNYSAKALIQPEGVETGWLPVASLWVGNGWGLFAPPKIGDVVEVRFQEGGKEAGMIGLRHFGDVFRPLPVPSGEFWLQHQSGSFLKFKNDGSVEVNAAANLTATVAGNASVTVEGDVTASVEGSVSATVGGQVTLNATGNVVATAPEFNLTGDVTIDGELFVTGDITDLNGTRGTVGNIRDVYNIHTHPPGSGGNTNIPNQQL
jgi:phage baseplate assembly protein gpV